MFAMRNGGPQVPYVCNTVCCLVPLHRCHVASMPCPCHTPNVTPHAPRPTCEIRPTGMSLVFRLLEGEGRPGPCKPCEGLRRDVREPLCSGPCSAKTCGRRANCHTQHAVKSCVPRRAESSRLPMPPPSRVYPLTIVVQEAIFTKKKWCFYVAGSTSSDRAGAWHPPMHTFRLSQKFKMLAIYCVYVRFERQRVQLYT